MKHYLILIFLTSFIFAQEQSDSQSTLGYIYLTVFSMSVVIFFWGIYKAVKTQKTIYALALLPFFLLMVGIFFI